MWSVLVQDGQRSTNRFRKKQISKLADLLNLSELLTFRKCGNFVDLRFGDPNFLEIQISWRLVELKFADPIFCGLKTSANPQKPNLSPHKE